MGVRPASHPVPAFLDIRELAQACAAIPAPSSEEAGREPPFCHVGPSSSPQSHCRAVCLGPGLCSEPHRTALCLCVYGINDSSFSTVFHFSGSLNPIKDLHLAAMKMLGGYGSKGGCE